MNYEIYLIGLAIASVLTGLVTEAVKKIMLEHQITYRANTIAGIVSTVLSLAFCIGYVLISQSEFTASTIVSIVVMVFLSWLGAMVGYDKVIQTVKQLKSKFTTDGDSSEDSKNE